MIVPPVFNDPVTVGIARRLGRVEVMLVAVLALVGVAREAVPPAASPRRRFGWSQRRDRPHKIARRRLSNRCPVTACARTRALIAVPRDIKASRLRPR